MVQHIQAGGDVGVLHEGVGGEDADQADVFHGEGAAFADASDPCADALGEQEVEQVVDEEQRGDVRRRIAELLHHQKAGEHHEDLPSGAGEERQAVVEPIARAQHHFLALGRLGREVGEARQGQRDQHRCPAGGQVDPVIGEAEDFQHHVHRGERHQRGCRTHGDEAAENARGFVLGEPLQGEGLADRLEVMEADGHEHGREVEAVLAREVAGDGHADAEQRHRKHGEGLLAQHQDDEHRSEGEEARHFPQALQDADFAPGERRLLDGEIVQERLPGGEAERHRHARQHQKAHRRAPLGRCLAAGAAEHPLQGHPFSRRRSRADECRTAAVRGPRRSPAAPPHRCG